MHRATFDAPGSHEFGDASITDGLPHAAFSHAKPSDVSKGGVGFCDSLDVTAGGGGIGAGRAHPTSAVPITANATSAIVPETTAGVRRDVGSAMRSCHRTATSSVPVSTRRPYRKLLSMLRVIQWATGNVGRHAVAAVHDHPDLELVGALVYSDAKAGRDVGDVCGIGDIGVIATADPDEIVALDADCVLYMPQGEMNPKGAIDDICRLLASGKNVVSTAVTGLIYPLSLGHKMVDKLESACAAGQASFHATGIEPGWAAEVLPLAMSGLFQRIDSLLVQELMDCTTYDSAEMLFDIMGFGKLPDEPVPMADANLAGVTFRAPLMLLADGLSAPIDDFVYHRDVAVAHEPFDIKAGRIEAGTVSAQRFGHTAVIDGRPALTVEHITRLGDAQAPDWPAGRGWKVTVEGRPSMMLDSQIATHGEDETDQGCLATAMHAVHAIAPVCAAAPGIRTFLDLPVITGRHALTR